jgi:hypothetical protein
MNKEKLELKEYLRYLKELLDDKIARRKIICDKISDITHVMTLTVQPHEVIKLSAELVYQSKQLVEVCEAIDGYEEDLLAKNQELTEFDDPMVDVKIVVETMRSIKKSELKDYDQNAVFDIYENWDGISGTDLGGNTISIEEVK